MPVAPTKLHLGCGRRHIPGWHHVDLMAYRHVDRVGPAERLDHIADDSVEIIYASHVLEHFGRYEVFDVVSEWYRVLRTGGILRVSVPDLSAICRRYLACGDIREVLGLLVGGQTGPLDCHKTVFDAASLGELMEDVGFAEVRHYDWRETEHHFIDDFSQAYLPHMDKRKGLQMSLNVEAVK
ncbi:MAG TPA: methyltransferase domain-containing protein [Alphaproteobacteria bacterium]